MSQGQPPRWLSWARELQAIAQIGLHYAQDSFDRQRYTRIRELAAEITSAHSDLPVAEILANFELQPGYATVKVDVRGAVLRDGKLLMVQEWSDELWCMPGGWADVGDSPSAMVEREVQEETGFQVRARKLLAVYDANQKDPLTFHHSYKLLFLCELLGGEARTSEETLAVEFFPLDSLPRFSPMRTTERHIEHLQAHLREPARPTDFD